MTGKRQPSPRSETVPGAAVEIVVEAGDWPRAAALRRLAEPALAAASRSSGVRLAPGSEVALVFSDDRHVRRLNRRFRGKDKATNVLSFPAAPPVKGIYGPLVGDIVLAAETVGREAADGGIPLSDYVIHLIVHGFLHLVGYDHEVDREALAMERLETAILAGLGIADPYADDAGR